MQALPWDIDHMMQGFSNKYLDLQVNISSYHLSLLNFSLSQSLLIFARSLTKIGLASMNQTLMMVATKSCSLLFDLYPRIFVKQALMVVAAKLWEPKFTLSISV